MGKSKKRPGGKRRNGAIKALHSSAFKAVTWLPPSWERAGAGRGLEVLVFTVWTFT